MNKARLAEAGRGSFNLNSSFQSHFGGGGQVRSVPRWTSGRKALISELKIEIGERDKIKNSNLMKFRF